MAEMHYSEYLNKVRGCIMGLGDMSWIEPALRVVAKSGADFTAMQLADAYEKGGALTPHFLRNMDRGIFPPLAVFDDPEQGGAGGMDCAPLWACVCPGDPVRARICRARCFGGPSGRGGRGRAVPGRSNGAGLHQGRRGAVPEGCGGGSAGRTAAWRIWWRTPAPFAARTPRRPERAWIGAMAAWTARSSRRWRRC